jgi:hypothetical protein
MRHAVLVALRSIRANGVSNDPCNDLTTNFSLDPFPYV